MFGRPHPEPLLTKGELDGALMIVMRIDDRIERICEYLDLEEDDDGEEVPEEDT